MTHRVVNELSLQQPLGFYKTDGENGSSIHTIRYPSSAFICRMFVASNALQLSVETRFTAVVLLYRYAHAVHQHFGQKAHHNQAKSDEWPWIGGVCIFLACKAEEEHRRLRDIINVVTMVLEKKEIDPRSDDSVNGAISKVPQKALLHVQSKPPPLDEEYWSIKKRVIEIEQAVLRWLEFDCYVSHPHRAVLLLLEDNSIDPQGDGPGKLIANTAFCLLNNALFSPKSLQFPLLVLACASMEIAMANVCGKLNAMENTRISHLIKCAWWRKFDISADKLEDCKKALLEASSILQSDYPGS